MYGIQDKQYHLEDCHIPGRKPRFLISGHHRKSRYLSVYNGDKSHKNLHPDQFRPTVRACSLTYRLAKKAQNMASGSFEHHNVDI